MDGKLNSLFPRTETQAASPLGPAWKGLKKAARMGNGDQVDRFSVLLRSYGVPTAFILF